MDSTTLVILSGVTTHGVLLVLAIRELVVLRRYRDDDDRDRRRDPDPAPTPPPFDAPSGVRPMLPDCLRPELMDLRPEGGVRPRVLEPV